MSTMERDAAEVWHRLREIWPDLEWDALETRHGAFHHVALLGDSAVVRATFARDHERQAQAEHENLRVIADAGLPYAVPRPLHGPYTAGGWSATAMTVVGGEQRADLPWPHVRDEMERVLKAFASAPVGRLAGLRPVRDWCGGDRWPQIVDRIVAGLQPEEASAARHVVSDVVVLEEPRHLVLAHGDFGMHNLLWEGDEITGIIDFDNTCLADPAIDLAPLIGAFGSAAVLEIADAGTVARASVQRASLSLQVAAAAQLAGDVGLRDFALQNFVRRYRAGTLYEPDL